MSRPRGMRNSVEEANNRAKPDYLPTPEEIRRACIEIRKKAPRPRSGGVVRWKLPGSDKFPRLKGYELCKRTKPHPNQLSEPSPSVTPNQPPAT